MSTQLQSPFVSWQIMSGKRNIGLEDHRVLLIGQGAGTATAKVLIEDVQLTEIDSLLGANSLATLAYKRFKTYNKLTEVDIIPLAEPTGTPAAGSIIVTGTAGESVSLTINVGDDVYPVTVAIVLADAAAAVATKIAAAIGALDLFSAAVDGVDDTKVNVTYLYDGEVGNGLSIVPQARVSGLTFTIVNLTGGTGAYDSANILDSLTKRYHSVIFDAAASFDAIETFLEARVNVENIVLGGSGFVMINDSLADLKSFANAKNSKTMVVIGNPAEMQLNAIPILATAEFVAKRALRLTEGAVLGNLVLDANEAYGGIEKHSLPYHNTPMSYKKPVGLITLAQLQDLTDAGISFIVPADTGTTLGDFVTLYKLDNAGIADPNFKFLNAVDTSLAIQEYLFNNCKSQFGQTRATNGDLVEGISMQNTLSVKGFVLGLYKNLVSFALAQGSNEAIKYFQDNTTVTLDAATGYFSVYAPVAIVSQLRGLNGIVAISYIFG